MKKIKVYNLAKMVQEMKFKNLPQQTTQSNHKMAIIEGINGVIIFDDEATGYIKKSVNDEIEIGICEMVEGKFFCLPQHTIKVSIKDIYDNAAYEEIILDEFITDRRHRKERIKENFKTLLNTINKIGLNKEEFYKSA